MITLKGHTSLNRYIRMTIGFIISLIFIILAFSKIDLIILINNVKSIDIYLVIYSIFFFGLSCVFRSLGWKITTGKYGNVSIKSLYGGIIVGYLANNFLPLKGGEFVRAHYLSKTNHIPYPSSLSTVMIERVFDVIVLLILLLGIILFGINKIPAETLNRTVAILSIVLLLIVLVIYLLRFAKNPDSRLTGILLKLYNIMEQFIEPFNDILSFRKLLALSLCSITTWLCNYLSLFVLLKNISKFQFEAALILLLFVSLGLLIPSSPGSFGIMQMAFIMALAPYNCSKESAVALSLIYQAELYVFTLLIGIPVSYHVFFSNKKILQNEK